MSAPLSRELQVETSRRGYWIAMGLVVASVGIAAVFLWRIKNTVDEMPRAPANGEHVVNLPAGDLVVFGELQSASTGSVRCGAKDAAGTELKLADMGSTTISYDVGSHSGRSMFELEVPAAGPVTIRCETDADLVLAFGKGIGKSIGLCAALTLAAFFSGCFAFGRTFLRRRRERKASQFVPQAAPPPPAA